MNSEYAIGILNSPLQRLVSRPRKVWQNICLSILLLMAPLGALWLDGLWEEAFRLGYWRSTLLPAVITAYILIIAPLMSRSEMAMLASLAGLVQMEEEQVLLTIRQSSRVNPWSELVSFGLGSVIGLWMNRSWVMEATTFWLYWYLLISLALMFGLLGWVIYNAVISTRVVGELHRLPLAIDIFDIRPFEPIGRHSLILTLAFLGGILVSMLFGFNFSHIFAWQTWQVIAPLSLVAVVMFFLNMGPTQRVLMEEKKRQLALVEARLLAASREIQRKLEQGGQLGSLSEAYNALNAYEARLRATRTWPYNTRMLRMLFFSILLPLLVRGVSSLLFEN